MEKRFGRRIKFEIDNLRGKGLIPLRKENTIFITVPILEKENVQSVVILLGILKFRQTLLNKIGRDVINYMVNLFTKKYEIEIVLGPRWPFCSPEVYMEHFYVSPHPSWTADYKLYDIIKSFKLQHCDLNKSDKVCSAPSYVGGFFFMKKDLFRVQKIV